MARKNAGVEAPGQPDLDLVPAHADPLADGTPFGDPGAAAQWRCERFAARRARLHRAAYACSGPDSLSNVGRRTQEDRRAETERRVIEAATSLIATSGSRRMTLAHVGEAAGYSRGIVYHQFGSRERLVEAVLDRAQRMELPAYDGNGLDQLVGIVETYLGVVAERAPLTQAFLQLWMEALAGDPVIAPLFSERDQGFRQLLSDAVERGVADGSIAQDAVAAGAGTVLVAILRGCSVQMAASPMIDARSVTSEAVRTVRRAFASD